MTAQRFFALLHNRRGQRYLDLPDHLEQAAAEFTKATQYAPQWSVPWYNLGLVRKLQRQWAGSLAANLTAAELDSTDEAAWWNAGIAATALGNWPVARRAWQSFGITLPAGDGAISMNLGQVPIRLNPEGAAEVVWCRRIDPARAIIENIPLPTSGHRYGDLVLHDGAPTGTRIHAGHEVPVFDALQLLRPSAATTYSIAIQIGSEADMLALTSLAREHDLGIEDWETIRNLCKACSEGNPGAHPGATSYTDGQTLHLTIAAPSDAILRDVLSAWSDAHHHSGIGQITVLVPGAQPALS
jgi:tetratricopeptide (TPR) repeat protein